MMNNLSPEKKFRIYWGLGTIILAFVIAVGVSLLTEVIRNESNQPQATVSFSGHGEVKATPDIANISFTITKDADTVKDAQAGVATIEKKALDFLKSKSVDDKDISTTDASFYPKYEYQQGACPITPPTPMSEGSVSSSSTINAPTYCNPSKQVLVGYTASESISVKIRNVDSVGDITQGLGTVGVSNLNGPDFTIDNENALEEQARKLAIDDAKTKAQVLAKDLGVSLGKITDFNDSGASPVMYAAKNAVSMGAPAPAAAPAVIPSGQTTITSDVTITYEIK